MISFAHGLIYGPINPHETPETLPHRPRAPHRSVPRNLRPRALRRRINRGRFPLNGFVLHEDSARVIIATGFQTPSDNRKTGDMLQVWILCKAVDPVEAIRTGLDRLICGSCVHRGDGHGGDRSCYVNAGQAPLGIWRAWKAGRYPVLQFMDGFAGRKVRFGAYGDPTHLPLPLALAIAGVSSGWTGYTHQWRKPSLQPWRQILMASVDTVAELVIARSMGWSTFRVGSEAQPSESLCASDAFGTPCAVCLLCAGARGGLESVHIPPHGKGAGHFIEA